MLEQLFGSKTRVRLLRVFLNNPKEAYFVRELTRKIGSQINAIRIELKKLQELDLVSEVEIDDSEEEKGEKGQRSKQQRKYFRLNVECLIYPEMVALFTKARVMLEKDFVRRIAASGSISYLALTGIFTGEKDAPTDMLVVGTVKREKLASLIRAFEKEVGKEVNYTVMTPQEYRYRKDVTDRFLYSILEAKKLTVIDTISEMGR